MFGWLKRGNPGAAAPLERARALPGIFGDHAITHLWGYKDDSRLTGINSHGDFAAVNANLRITPDEANLDAVHGGLVVWDREAPAGRDFDAYTRRTRCASGRATRTGGST